MRCRLLAVFWGLLVAGLAHAQSDALPFTLISRVMEAGPRVVALSIDAGRDLQINWKLQSAFQVTAELLPVKTYAGDPIANSAAARAPRTITRAYTSAKPEIGSPAQGRYVIVELDADDFNAASWYLGFNPGIRQLIPYGDAMVYNVRLLNDINYFVPNASPTRPGANVDVISAGTTLRRAGARIATADDFAQGVLEMPSNAQTRFIAYNLYRPANIPAGSKVPLVVFLHGSGQSHDYAAFASQPAADTRSPLLANQGGVAWIENAKEKCFVLVPQAPARDTDDAARERGWRSADTQKLLLGLVDKVIAENPAIDTGRLYLTGLSMGAMGSWKIITHPDPAISRKFAAAALFAGAPTAFSGAAPGESLDQWRAKLLPTFQAAEFRNVSIPVWLGHSNTDPVVDRLGSRVPFVELTGAASLSPGGELVPAAGVLASDSGLARHYRAKNRNSGADVRYTEYQFNGGDRFLEIGMVTRHGHFSWEAAYKDRAIVDWMFSQRK